MGDAGKQMARRLATRKLPSCLVLGAFIKLTRLIALALFTFKTGGSHVQRFVRKRPMGEQYLPRDLKMVPRAHLTGITSSVFHLVK